MPDWLPPAVAAFLCWGIWAFLPKLSMAYIDPRNAAIWEAAGGVAVAMVLLALPGFKPGGDLRGMALAAITGGLGIAGALAYLHAMARGPVVLISTLTALYPVLAILLAVFLLHEPISLRQGIGIVLALAAMALIAS